MASILPSWCLEFPGFESWMCVNGKNLFTRKQQHHVTPVTFPFVWMNLEKGKGKKPVHFIAKCEKCKLPRIRYNNQMVFSLHLKKRTIPYQINISSSNTTYKGTSYKEFRIHRLADPWSLRMELVIPRYNSHIFNRAK
jgi:hypothetical protein